jgi:hypothetical protein
MINSQTAALVTYGFGRRICPGRYGLFPCTLRFYLFIYRHIANNSLFINIATILWTLTIEPARDDKGEYIMPIVEGDANAGVVL